MEAEGQRVRPEIPHRPQHRGQQREVKRSASRQPQQHIQPEDALHLPQQKEEDGRQGHGAVGSVGEEGEPGMPQPEGPQQVIQQGGAHSQQDGLAEDDQLDGDVVPHLSRTGGAGSRPVPRHPPRRR